MFPAEDLFDGLARAKTARIDLGISPETGCGVGARFALWRFTGALIDKGIAIPFRAEIVSEFMVESASSEPLSEGRAIRMQLYIDLL